MHHCQNSTEKHVNGWLPVGSTEWGTGPDKGGLRVSEVRAGPRSLMQFAQQRKEGVRTLRDRAGLLNESLWFLTHVKEDTLPCTVLLAPPPPWFAGTLEESSCKVAEHTWRVRSSSLGGQRVEKMTFRRSLLCSSRRSEENSLSICWRVQTSISWDTIHKLSWQLHFQRGLTS